VKRLAPRTDFQRLTDRALGLLLVSKLELGQRERLQQVNALGQARETLACGVSRWEEPP
jgi:hypothetical protein